MRSIAQKTEDLINDIDFLSLKHTKIIEDNPEDDHIRTVLEIRGRQVPLLDYDYYLLLAIEWTDHIPGISYDYVQNLRNAIREDINHANNLLQIIEDNGTFSKSEFDTFIGAYDEYWRNSELFLEDYSRIEAWNRKYAEELYG